jgi:hypothetical protein
VGETLEELNAKSHALLSALTGVTRDAENAGQLMKGRWVHCRQLVSQS